MSINLDNLAQAGQAGGRADRRNPGARQDRWLLELEQAMFAQARNKPAQRDTAAAGDGQGSQPLAQAAATAAPEPQLLAAGLAALPAQRAAQEAAPALAQGPASAPQAQDKRLDQAPAMPHSDVVAADTQGGADQQSARAPLQLALAALGGAPAAAGLAGVAAATYSRLAAQPEGVEGGSTLRQAERAAGGLPGWLAPPGPELAPERELPPAPAQAEAPAEDAAAQGGAAAEDDYGVRNMHLYREGQEVQAWLRDSALRPEQAAGLAQAVAAALADEGAQLRALTLNGKPVPLRESRAGKEQDSFADSLAASGYAYNVKGTN